MMGCQLHGGGKKRGRKHLYPIKDEREEIFAEKFSHFFPTKGITSRQKKKAQFHNTITPFHYSKHRNCLIDRTWSNDAGQTHCTPKKKKRDSKAARQPHKYQGNSLMELSNLRQAICNLFYLSSWKRTIRTGICISCPNAINSFN